MLHPVFIIQHLSTFILSSYHLSIIRDVKISSVTVAAIWFKRMCDIDFGKHAPSYNMQHATCSMQHATCSMQHATCDMQHATCDMRHATCDMQHANAHRLCDYEFECAGNHRLELEWDVSGTIGHHHALPPGTLHVACCMLPEQFSIAWPMTRPTLHVACCMQTGLHLKRDKPAF